MAKKTIDITKSATENAGNINDNFTELYGATSGNKAIATTITRGDNVGSTTEPDVWGCGLIVNLFNSARMNQDLGLSRISAQSGKIASENSQHFSHGSKTLIGSDGKAYTFAAVNLKVNYDSPDSPSQTAWLTIADLGDNVTDRIEIEDTYVAFRVNDPVIDEDNDRTLYISSGSGGGQLYWVDSTTLRMTATVCLHTSQNDLVTVDANDRFAMSKDDALANWTMTKDQIMARRTDTYLIYRDFDIENKTFGNIGICKFRYTPAGGSQTTVQFTQSAILEFCKQQTYTKGGTSYPIIASNGNFGTGDNQYFWFNFTSTYGTYNGYCYAAVGVSTYIKNGLILKTDDFETFDFHLYPVYSTTDGNINIKFEVSCYVAKGGSTANCLWVASRLNSEKMYLACMSIDGSTIYSYTEIDEGFASRNEIFADYSGKNVFVMHSINGRNESAVERCSNIHSMSNGMCGRVASGFYMSYPSVAPVISNSAIAYYVVSYTDNHRVFIGKFRMPYNNTNAIPTLAAMLDAYSPQ